MGTIIKYRGIKGLQQVHNLLLKTLPKGGEYYAIGAPVEAGSMLNQFWKTHTDKRIKKQITMKIVVNNGHPQMEEFRKAPYTLVKIMPEQYRTPVWTLIFKNYVALCSFSQKESVVLIRGSDIAKSYKQYFDYFWQTARRMDNMEYYEYDAKSVYQSFLEHTDQKVHERAFLKRLLDRFQHQTPNILDIGTAGGDLILGTLKTSKLNSYSLSIIEPVIDQIKRFQNNIRKAGLQKHVKKIYLNKWEAFQASDRFDFILCSHMFYYISDWDETIPKVAGFLKPNGQACIVLQSEKNDNFQLRKLFFPSLHKIDYGHDTIEHIASILRSNAIKYKLRYVTSCLDISSICKPNISQTGKNLLTFIVNSSFDSLGLDQQRAIVEKVRSMKKMRRGKSYLRLVDGFITLWKQ